MSIFAPIIERLPVKPFFILKDSPVILMLNQMFEL